MKQCKVSVFDNRRILKCNLRIFLNLSVPLISQPNHLGHLDGRRSNI